MELTTTRWQRATRRLRRLDAALLNAETYAEWQQVAEEHDRLTGMDAWRADDESPHYDAPLLRAEIVRLKALRQSDDAWGLAKQLHESVTRHKGDVTAPDLYDQALSGTKHLVTDYLDEVEASLRYLASSRLAGLDESQQMRRFVEAQRVFGRSALMLSGGATWGFFHIGVCKALFENDLLPDILSGASTGAMIAAGVGTRTDAELQHLFDHPEEMRRDGLQPLAAKEALRTGAILDSEALHDVLRHNVGEYTFAEAAARSGRSLNISVSPTRHRQKPRLLNALTSPDVLVASAAVASSALPGLFPPAMLQQRVQRRTKARHLQTEPAVVPYIPTERWVDGSIHGDLPKLRLARLHDVNHFIVSQTNPHIVPFVRQRSRGVFSTAAALTTAAVRHQGAYAAELAQRATSGSRGPVGLMAEQARALVSQDYRGDIDIHPRFRMDLLGKMVVNPSLDDLKTFIQEGERATWPKLAMVRDQTRICRTFAACIAELNGSAATAGSQAG